MLAVGAAALTLALPPIASADVSVRVEGDAATLLAPTAQPIAGPAVVKDGVNSCPGDRAIGAFDRALAGDWAGPWFTGLGYAVDAIRGEAYAFPVDRYWVFYINEQMASFGLCDQVVQDGDRILLAPSGTGYAAGRALRVAAAASAAPGTAFTVTVTDGESKPVEAAQVVPAAGGAPLATTGADGTASVTLTERGPASLRAVKPGDVRSAPAAVCVSDGADGFCGSAKPGAPAPAPSPAPAPDTTPALGRISGLGEQQRFARGKGPRELKGVVDADPSGLREVRLRLTRRVPATPAGRRACSTWDAARERFVRSACGVRAGRWFKVGDRAAWSYLLPARLGPGRYVLDVQAVDGAGNTAPEDVRAKDAGAPRTRVVFVVGS
jgi:hypothetical protein